MTLGRRYSIGGIYTLQNIYRGIYLYISRLWLYSSLCGYYFMLICIWQIHAGSYILRGDNVEVNVSNCLRVLSMRLMCTDEFFRSQWDTLN